jgi:2,4-dienoyl-CoA reductase (NADPH2)
MARLSDLTSGAEEFVPCDFLVRQTGRSAHLPAAFRGAAEGPVEVHCVGDCVTPRRISHALFEAQRVARAIL